MSKLFSYGIKAQQHSSEPSAAIAYSIDVTNVRAVAGWLVNHILFQALAARGSASKSFKLSYVMEPLGKIKSDESLVQVKLNSAHYHLNEVIELQKCMESDSDGTVLQFDDFVADVNVSKSGSVISIEADVIFTEENEDDLENSSELFFTEVM